MPKKKILPELTANFQSVKLYLDDIERIIEILEQTPDTQKITFSTGDYQYENLTELLSDRKDVIHNLRIRRYSEPGFVDDYVLILDYGGSLTFREVSVTRRGIYMELRDFLRSKRRLFNYVMLLGPILLGVSMLSWILHPPSLSSLVTHGIDILLVVVPVILVWSFLFWYFYRSEIVLSRHDEQTGLFGPNGREFWSKFWPAIIVGFIMLLLGKLWR